MQHLLLAIAIISLTLIAGNGRGKASPEVNKVSMKIEQPAINEADNEIPAVKPSVLFTRLDMFVY